MSTRNDLHFIYYTCPMSLLWEVYCYITAIRVDSYNKHKYNIIFPHTCISSIEFISETSLSWTSLGSIYVFGIDRCMVYTDFLHLNLFKVQLIQDSVLLRGRVSMYFCFKLLKMTTKGHHRQIWFTCFTGEDSNLSENQKQNQKMAKQVKTSISQWNVINRFISSLTFKLNHLRHLCQWKWKMCSILISFKILTSHVVLEKWMTWKQKFSTNVFS